MLKRRKTKEEWGRDKRSGGDGIRRDAGVS